MTKPRTFRQMNKNGGGLGVWVIARTRPGHAHEYWSGGGIIKRRQRWVFEAHRSFRFKSREAASETLLRLRDWAGRVDDIRLVVTTDDYEAKDVTCV